MAACGWLDGGTYPLSTTGPGGRFGLACGGAAAAKATENKVWKMDLHV
jgi:hypothetical protein